MDELVKNLMEELNCDTAFTIPIFGGIPVAESVFVTWLIMAVVILLCAIFVRNLKVTTPGKGQLLLETAVSGIYSFFEDILGEKGKRFIPYLMSVGIYIGITNLIGILGFKPPTKDINVTASLAILSIILIELSGVLAKRRPRLAEKASQNRWLSFYRSTSLRFSSDHFHYVCDYSATFLARLSLWNC